MNEPKGSSEAMTPLDFAVQSLRAQGAPCDLSAADEAEGELRALREDRASIDAMATLLGRARSERDTLRTQLADATKKGADLAIRHANDAVEMDQLRASLQAAIQRAEKAETEILEAAIDRICADDSWHTDDIAWHACFPALFDIIRGSK